MNKKIVKIIENNHYIYFTNTIEMQQQAITSDIVKINSNKQSIRDIEKYKKEFPNKFFILDEGEFNCEKVSEKFITINNNILKTVNEIEKNTVYSHLENYRENILKGEQCFSTNIKELDNFFNGGIYNQLYIIGAISGMGKSTLMYQIADILASQGKDVMYFTFEQNKIHLINKSLTRLNYETFNKTDISTDDILKNKIDEKRFDDLIKIYGDKIGRNMFIYDNIEKFDDIKKSIEVNIKTRKMKPVVIIDYLQIIPYKKHSSNIKEKIDKILNAFRNICNSFNIPIFIISSLNRNSYNRRILLTSFKESGSIEYSADVILGLEFSHIDYEKSPLYIESKADKLKNKQKRKVDFVMLKYRNSRMDKKLKMNYIANANYFAFQNVH